MSESDSNQQESTVSTPIDRLVFIKEVAAMLSMSVRTMERRFAEGKLPLPERVGKHQKRVYRESKIPELIQLVTGGTQ